MVVGTWPPGLWDIRHVQEEWGPSFLMSCHEWSRRLDHLAPSSWSSNHSKPTHPTWISASRMNHLLTIHQLSGRRTALSLPKIRLVACRFVYSSFHQHLVNWNVSYGARWLVRASIELGDQHGGGCNGNSCYNIRGLESQCKVWGMSPSHFQLPLSPHPTTTVALLLLNSSVPFLLLTSYFYLIATGSTTR